VQSMDADSRHGRAALASAPPRLAAAAATRGSCHATACTQSSWPSRSASSDAARARSPAANVSLGAYLQQAPGLRQLPPRQPAPSSGSVCYGSLRRQRLWNMTRRPVPVRHQRASPLSLHQSRCKGRAYLSRTGAGASTAQCCARGRRHGRRRRAVRPQPAGWPTRGCCGPGSRWPAAARRLRAAAPVDGARLEARSSCWGCANLP